MNKALLNLSVDFRSRRSLSAGGLGASSSLCSCGVSLDPLSRRSLAPAAKINVAVKLQSVLAEPKKKTLVYFTSATTSISTRESFGNRATSTQERAGLLDEKYSP
jgi:hypothetical protein